MAQQSATNPTYYSQEKPIYPSVPQAPPAYGALPQGGQYIPGTSSYVAPQGTVDSGQVIIVQQPPPVMLNPTVVSATMFGPVPQIVDCPFCHARVTTSISYELGGLVWLVFALLIIFGCILFSWIPCVIKDCKDVLHKCPQCHRVLGKFRRI